VANFLDCIDFVLDNEDRTRACAIVSDPTKKDPHAHAIAGINSSVFPEDYKDIASLEPHERGTSVKAFYASRFWNQWFTKLGSDEVAKRVLDTAVNMGSVTAVKLLQEAVNLSGTNKVEVDGYWGPNTLTAVNSCNAGILVEQFKNTRIEQYKAIGGVNVKNWIARASL
jgi:lysozyme family protein